MENKIIRFKIRNKDFFIQLVYVTIFCSIILLIIDETCLFKILSLGCIISIAIILFLCKRKLRGLLVDYDNNMIIMQSEKLFHKEIIKIDDISQLRISYRKKPISRGSFGYFLGLYVNNKKYLEIGPNIFGCKKEMITNMLNALTEMGIKRIE